MSLKIESYHPELQNKVCIVTGGGSGIGRDAAIKLAGYGAKIVLAGRTKEKVEFVRDEILDNGGTAAAYTLDVADKPAVQEMVKRVRETFVRIDVLVNCAGHSSPGRLLLETTSEDLRTVINSNLIGTIYCIQAVVPTMLERKSGTIINVSSMATLTPILLGGLAYAVSKAGVNLLTEFVNEELENTGIRASIIIPGEVNTPIVDNRPIPPPDSVRAKMLSVEDTSAAICLMAGLPPRAHIPSLYIRPTAVRDMTVEIPSTSELESQNKSGV